MRHTLALLLGMSSALANGAEPVDFNRDVRPILSESCFQCHGPDTAKRKAGLRLDTREGLFRSKDGSTVVVPGDPEESDLVFRVESDDPELVMPPPDSGKPLTGGQAETLRRWVAEGAAYQGHWAYVPPIRPVPPDLSGFADKAPAGFVRDDIDRFVLDTLLKRGLTPSPEADKVTLIRRLSFDLTGLPPTPEDVDAFVNDPASDAYEKLVDRLFASPHHGERLASWWLDLVRYADTTGYHGDNHREVSLYRDWVINAFNANKPFDAFTVEQLAGDLLPNPTNDQRIASGYNKMLMTTQEGGAQAKEYTAKYAADRVRNASTVWLGSTLGCAECHDHKYDPFTTRDFYQFAAFFADIQEVAVGVQEQVPFPNPEQAVKISEIDAEIARLQREIDQQPLTDPQARWEKTAGSETHWAVLQPISAVSQGGATLEAKEDDSVLASGKNPARDTYKLTFRAPRGGLNGLRLELIPDGSLPALGPGRASNGNLVLNSLKLSIGERAVAWASASATFAQGGFPIAGAIDNDPKTGWGLAGQNGRPNQAVFESAEPFGATDAELTLTLNFGHGESHAMGRFRVLATDAPRPIPPAAYPSEITSALNVPEADRTDAHRSTLSTYYRSIAPELQPGRDAIAALKARRAEVEAAMPRTVVTRAGERRTMRILPRGNWLDESGPVVSASIPTFLKTSTNTDAIASGDRLALARWVVSRGNPLTARVFANRLWSLAFGQGIVATQDDFGAQGAWPTHPELLDHLAIAFIEGGWNVRELLRRIVTSGTYRQSSKATDSLRQADPYNQWLARQGRFRLDAEGVRDTALAVSGLLVRKVGGAPARPYQPAGYWSHLNFPKREYQPDEGEGLYRRGLYTYWCRTFLHPSLLAFDAPTREECTVRRTRSNTPIQALVLLNDPTYVEAARSLAERALRAGGPDDASRLHWLYREALSRAPRAAESEVLEALLEKHRRQYRADVPAASGLIQTGELPAPADLDPVELASWTSVARTLLNLHETITRY